MTRPTLYVKHRFKLALAALVRFVIARPALFSMGLRVVNAFPRLKWFLWRIHRSAQQGSVAVAPRLPGEIPLAARGLYQQLTQSQNEVR